MSHDPCPVDPTNATGDACRDVISCTSPCSAIASPDATVDAEKVADDLRSRLACVVEATYWDRPYEERIAAIRGMCDLTTDGLTPAPEGATTAEHLAAQRRSLLEAVERRILRGSWSDLAVFAIRTAIREVADGQS